jgi:hypothetical protein
MKRKIERYLGNGNDANIRYLEDGRFDFNGDMDGVLLAVRESEGRKSSSGKKNSKTPSNATRLYNSNAFRNRNSASRILFDVRTPHQPVSQPEAMDYFVENIFASPDSNADATNVVIQSQQTKVKPQPTAATGQTSILRTPQFKAAARSPPFTNNSLIKTPAGGFDMQGFTPLSTNAKTTFVESEMFEYGLFSPNGPLGDDFVMEGVKTPSANYNPRVCIANVRFGDSPSTLDQKQRNVAISPIKSAGEIFQKRKRQPLFLDSCKKRKNSKDDAFAFGLVTPSISVSSRTTVATLPLTVCSSASSTRTTLTMEELGKVRINSSGSTISKNAADTSFDCSGMEPKQITQETPRESPLFSPPLNFDKLGDSILRSAKKMDACTPAEKFWSSVGGLDNFTPFRENVEGVGESSLMSPTSNSEYCSLVQRALHSIGCFLTVKITYSR